MAKRERDHDTAENVVSSFPFELAILQLHANHDSNIALESFVLVFSETI